MRRALLRYRYPDGRPQAALPLHVVEESRDRIVGWMAPGTSISYWATADGGDPRDLPLKSRFLDRLGTAPRVWTGSGVLRVIPFAECWQALHFWDGQTGSFDSWYVNLESPKVRTGSAIDAVDWHLDLVLDAALRPRWKDEDEAAAAVGTPCLRLEYLARARQTGERIAADPRSWLSKVGDWRDFVPRREWAALDLPQGWDDGLT